MAEAGRASIETRLATAEDLPALEANETAKENNADHEDDMRMLEEGMNPPERDDFFDQVFAEASRAQTAECGSSSGASLPRPLLAT